MLLPVSSGFCRSFWNFDENLAIREKVTPQSRSSSWLGGCITVRYAACVCSVSLLWKSLPAKAQCQLISDCKEKNNLKRKAVRLRELSVTGNPRGSLCMHRVVLDDRGVWTSSTETIFRVPWQYKNGSLTTDPTRVERFKRMAGGEFSQNVGDFTLGPHHLITGHWWVTLRASAQFREK